MRNRVAVVTGSTGGIGRAIVRMLTDRDFKVYGIARTASDKPPGIGLKIDLTNTHEVDNVIDLICRNSRVDLLVHAAGTFYHGPDLNQLAYQHTVNVAAPHYLTRGLLSRLAETQGCVVFLNSLAALGSKREKVAQYATTKRALKDVADRLRQDLNPLGVHVTSLFLGQVATEMQRQNYEMEGWEYHPEALMQPDDVAAVVVDIFNLPARAEITDLTLRSTQVQAA